MNAEKSGRQDGRKLTGSESWFVRKLTEADNGPLANFLALLTDVRMMFQHDPRTARTAGAVEKILDGRGVMFQVRRYLESL
ncbi:MAG: hypothetical protein ACLQU4_00635 [Limisphaerales bacterium]